MIRVEIRRAAHKAKINVRTTVDRPGGPTPLPPTAFPRMSRSAVLLSMPTGRILDDVRDDN